jgi:multicomponent Na+:H+ antiporter subunit E
MEVFYIRKFKAKCKFFIILLICWLIFTFDFSLWNIILGVFINIVIIKLSFGVIYDSSNFLVQVPSTFTMVLYLLRLIYEIYKSSFLQILRIIKKDNNPVIVKVELEVTNPFLVTIIANSITLTPGTITVDVEDNTLYVLSIKDDGEDGQKLKKDIKNKFEKYFIKKG